MAVVFIRRSNLSTSIRRQNLFLGLVSRPRRWCAAAEIEPARREERIPRRAGLADARIGDGLVLELPRLDALELLELLREDRDRGPRLHRRTHRLVEAAPEPRERSLVEARRQDHVEPEVVLEGL